MSAMQQGSIAAGTSAVSFWPLFAAPGVPQDISSRSFVYYCDRRCTMPPVCRSAPSRCNVLPTALLLCCAISAYCFTITAGISLSRGRTKVSANEVTEACRKMGRLRQKRLFLTETGRFVGRLRHLERWRHPCVSGLYFQTLRVSKESCRILPSVDCCVHLCPLPSEDPASFYANSPSDDFDRTISSCTRMIIRSPLPWSSTKQSPMTRCISLSPSSGTGRASAMPFIRWFSNNRQLFYVNRVQRASVYLYL